MVSVYVRFILVFNIFERINCLVDNQLSLQPSIFSFYLALQVELNLSSYVHPTEWCTTLSDEVSFHLTLIIQDRMIALSR